MNLVRSWPQGQAGPTPLGWSLPQPLMPPRINGWPQGVVPSSDAEALLESAVAWWDASRYRDGDRFLRNQGIAGELLDLRLGSSVAANTNDPTWLGVQDSGYAYLPGVVGNYLSVPDEAALDITGDIDIRVRVALDDWTPAANQTLVSKWLPGQASFILEVAATTGYLRWYWSADGTASLNALSTAAPTVADGGVLWVRATIDVDNGASGRDVKFWTSPDGAAWTQLGSTVTSAGATSIFASTTAVEIGRYSSTMLTARVYRAQVLNGIDGTTVLDIDCDAITSGSATSFTATTGQTVTINRSTSGRKSVAQPRRGISRANFLLGTDDYFEIPADRTWQHQLLNFGQADSFTVLAVARAWNASSSNVVLSKSDNVASIMIGYAVPESASTYRLSIGDGSRSFASSGPRTAGTLYAIAATRNVRDRTLASYLNGVAGTAAADSTRSIYSPLSFYVGRVGATYADMEFLGAAVFRRALTAAEITSITRYYGAS